MATLTLSTVRSLVRSRGDLPLSRKFTDDYLDTEIQASWSALHRLVEGVNEGWWDKDATVTTTQNVAYVALPADAWKVKGIDILISSEYLPLRQIPIQARVRYLDTPDQPEAYRLTERGIDLFPIPNATYTLRVTYARVVTPLSGVSVTVDDEWQDYVVWATILRIAPSEERPMNDYAAMVARAEDAIKDSASGRRKAEPEYLPLLEYRPGWWTY